MPAVVVVVEKRRARPHRLDEVLLRAGAVDVGKGDADRLGDVLERHVRLARAARPRDHQRRADECRPPHLLFNTSSIFCWLSRNWRRCSSIALACACSKRAAPAAPPRSVRGAAARGSARSARRASPASSVTARRSITTASSSRPAAACDLTNHGKRFRAGRVEQRRDEILRERFVQLVLRAIDLAEIEVRVRDRWARSARDGGTRRPRRRRRTARDAPGR